MKKVPRAERTRRVREVAEMVRLTGLLDKLPSACSGGEAQRVALARTLVTNPSTFLLDEPLSSLDAKLRRELRAECDRLHQELKKTFIFVTHDQEEAMTLADRIVVMRAGRDRADRLADGDLFQSGNRFRRRFLRLAVDEPDRRRDRRRRRRRPRFRSPQHLARRCPKRFDEAPPGPATLGHPARSTCACSAAGATGADLDLPVRLVEPLGKDTLLYFDIGAERPFIAVSEGLAMAEMEAGDPIRTDLDPGPACSCSLPTAGGSPEAVQEARRRCGRNSPAREVERGRNSSRWRGSQAGP